MYMYNIIIMLFLEFYKMWVFKKMQKITFLFLVVFLISKQLTAPAGLKCAAEEL